MRKTEDFTVVRAIKKYSYLVLFSFFVVQKLANYTSLMVGWNKYDSHIQWSLNIYLLLCSLATNGNQSVRLMTRVSHKTYRCSTTVGKRLLAQHVRDTPKAFINRCWHAGYYGDQTCRLHLQDCLFLFHPAALWSMTYCSIFDQGQAFWSGMMPWARGLISNFPPFLSSLYSPSHFIVIGRWKTDCSCMFDS